MDGELGVLLGHDPGSDVLVLDLAAAVRKLRSQRKDLIVCGVNRPQFKALSSAGLTQILGFENFCPDIDFALARAMNLVDELSAPAGNGSRPIAQT